MKYTLCILAAAAMIAGFSGCNKKEEVTPTETLKATTEKAKEWAPETAAPAHDPSDGGDHTGHNHN
ncbi:MAG: hypothetical protein PF904_09245 [Kiritimatiellae bacterium]|jgi:hypothetical protein|nr:hypothetical protein [Kiritimatiellia bacterium]